MKIDSKIILGILVIVFCIFLGYSTVSNYLVQYNTVGEALNQPVTTGSIQIIGTIDSSSFTNIYNDTYAFTLLDNTGLDMEIVVVYTGVLPSAFDTDGEVIVIGTFDENNTFNAGKLISRCPSKFTE